MNDLVRTADLKKPLSKGDTNNWSEKFYKITEIFNDTIATYHTDKLLGRYNETLLEKTNLSTKENKDVMKKLNLY